MSPVLISLMFSAGVAAFAYSRFFGPRLGYGNQQNVWLMTGITFVLVFVVLIITLTQVLHF